MTDKRMSLTVVLALAILAVAWFSRGAADAPVAKKWKYAAAIYVRFPSLKSSMWMGGSGKEFPKEAKFEEAMEIMGADGWELVSAVEDPSLKEPRSTTFYFKKPG